MTEAQSSAPSLAAIATELAMRRTGMAFQRTRMAAAIIYHLMFMLGLRRQRDALKAQDLVHGESGFPASLVLIVAVTLLLIGFAAAFSMIGHVGPYE